MHEHLGRGDGDELVGIALKGADRTRLLSRELSRVVWWVKLSLWLCGLFSVADRETLLIDQKLRVLRRKIRAHHANLVIFESRVLTNEFPQQPYVLYQALFPLIGLIRDFARNPKFIQEAFVFLMQARLEDPKRSLEQFIDADEMVQVLQDGDARDLCSEVTRRVNEHFDAVPASFYAELQRGLEPLLYLRGLALLPFVSIFSSFSYTLVGLPEPELPRFTTASVALLLDNAEKTHHGVCLATRLGEDSSLHPELITYYVAMNPTEAAEPQVQRAESAAEVEGESVAKVIATAEHENETQEPGAAAALAAADRAVAREPCDPTSARVGVAGQRPSDRARIVAQYEQSIAGVLKAAKDFAGAVPLLDIIRYFRDESYYSFAFTVPTYYTKDIHTGAMRKQVLAELEERIGEIERQVLSNRSEQLFGGVPLEPLQYYTEMLAQATAAQSSQYLTHVSSLTLLHNFLATVYRDRLRDPVRFLFNKIIQEDRVLMSRLGQHISGIEELRSAIALFDRSMAPDEEAGEALSRLQVAATLSGDSRRFLRQTVRSKDDEAAALVRRGNSHIAGLEQSIIEILSRPTTGAFAPLRRAPLRKVLDRVVATLHAAAHVLGEHPNFELRQGSKT